MEPFNPFRPEVIADPYPYYARYRQEDPVHWSSTLDAWVLTRYEDVSFVLRDPRFSANRRQGRNRFIQLAEARQQYVSPLGNVVTMLGADPPEHTRLRRLVSQSFTLKAINALRPRIEELVHQLLDGAEAKARREGYFDVIADLAYPLPVTVIAEMLGIPPEDMDTFKRWSDDIALSLEPFAPLQVLERVRRSMQEMVEYFQDALAQRRREPRQDIVSVLVEAEREGRVRSEEEAIATLILLLVAGNETTTNFLGNAVLALLRHPDQLQRLREDPALIERAVEELLRYDPPAQTTTRVALEEVEIGGRRIEPYQVVFAVLGAANHDPEVFPEPDRLDLTRHPNPHLAFGEGIHFCLGAPLARAESQIALRALLDRFPGIHLVEDEPCWRPNYILRGLKRLLVAPSTTGRTWA